MSHSVVKDTPTSTDNTLVIVVAQDGSISVDQETLDSLMSLGSHTTEVSVVRVNEDEGSTVDMTLDTYQHSDLMEDLTINVEEVQRNYNNFRMDHCYTPLTSPSQRHPVPTEENNDPDLELDDLAHTLSILEGSDKPITPQLVKVSNVKMPHKVVQKEPKINLIQNDKVSLINKVNKFGVNKVYKSVKTVLNKTPKVIKKTVVQQTIQNDDTEESDDDFNDSDFEINGSPKTKTNKRTYKRRPRLELPENENNIKQKVVKVRKGMKNNMYKPVPKPIEVEPKIEPVPDPVKSPEIKKAPPKKDKKLPKPVIDDGIALFSTPDIIRRVGSGKPGEKPEKTLESPESPKVPKPAKIEDRSRSETTRTSIDTKPKLSQRLSLDSKMTSPEKNTPSDPRARRNSDRKPVETISAIEPIMLFPQNNENIVPIPENNISMEQNSVFNNLSQDVKSIVEPVVPCVDAINAIIQGTDTSSIVPVESSNLTTDSPMGLEAPLDIDHAILENINTDELISEDILYQVAKLVENPDLQNAIDKTLVDGSLALDSAIHHQIQATPQTPIQETIHPLVQGIQNNTSAPVLKTPQRQVVRSDGRVLVLPPIEKPATRSSKKKQDVEVPLPPPPVQRPPVQVVQQPVVPHQVARLGPKVETIESEAPPSDADSDSDESWNSEDDPDRLWCICKQPHNNRFMICCDTCEDWFHGKCVNVTKAMGQQMEAQGKEWMCPNCIKKLNTEPTQVVTTNSTSPIPGKALTASVADKIDPSNHRKSVEGASPACIVCGAPSRASSVYCSDQCILKHAQGVERDTKQTVKSQPQRIIVFERATGKCLSGNNAPSAANLKQWLKDHPGFEVVRPVNKSMAQSKLQLVKNPAGKGVSLAVNRKGVQVGVLPHAPKPVPQIRLIPAAKLNVPGTKTPSAKQVNPPAPSKKLVQTTIKSPPNSTTPAKAKPVPPSPKVEKHTPLKTPKKPETLTQTTLDKSKAQENIRDNVKKTLFEQLMTRLKETEDITLAEDEVTKMAGDIEIQLFKLFGDAGPKYRTKYRSLIFNIKDPKNHTLWRRICDKAIAPAQLVRLSPDELASQELARWRERETKHQLDMIKKSELEMLSINRTYVLKTHKGEHVMEDRANKVDSADMMPGLGADSTSEDVLIPADKSDTSDHGSDRKNSKHKRDRERRTSKDRVLDSKDHKTNKEHNSKRRRSRSRDRSSHRSDRKRSRSRDRHHRSSHKSSRHKRDRHSIDYLDKKSKEILDNLENNKIVAPPEDRLWKHVPQQDIQVATPVDSDSDHEPTSTVTIPTPPRSVDQEEIPNTIPLPPVTEIVKPVTDSKVEPPAAKTTRSDPRLSRATPDVKIPSPPPPKVVEESKELPAPVEAKITSLDAETIVWEGNINMIDVAKFFITLHEVSGDCNGIGVELPPTLEIVGRISPDTVWEYIGKMRRSNSKMISVLRLTAANMEEKMPYIALYSYLSSRNRLGVIKSTNSAVKDFYILPLASHAPVPQSLLPLSGPGFEESRPHLLLGIIVRAKRKRPSVSDIVAAPTTKRTRLDNSPTMVLPTVAAPVPQRSYTPPPSRDPRIKLPTVPAAIENSPNNDEDEPYSPEDSDPESAGPILPEPRKPAKLPVPDLSSLLSTSSTPSVSSNNTSTLNAADISSLLTNSLKTNTFLDNTAVLPSFEPFTNKFDGIPGLDVDGVDSLQRKMEELDKCIEKQKEEIRSISQDIVSSGAAASMATNLSNISLPSNLQQILDSIKNIPSTTSLDSQDPSQTEEYSPSVPGYKSTPSGSEELTIPLLLPKLSSRTQLGIRNTHTPPETPSTIPLQLPVAPRESLPLSDCPAISSPTPSVIPNLNLSTLNLPNLSLPPPITSSNIPTNIISANMSVPPPSVQMGNLNMSSTSQTPTIPLNLPKLKPKLTPIAVLSPPGTSPVIIPANIESKATNDAKATSVLSSLSEEELIRKANEMLGESELPREETPEPEMKEILQTEFVIQKPAFKSAPVMYNTPPPIPNPPKRPKIDISQPPIPGLEEDEY